jgi:hypothetical protein
MLPHLVTKAWMDMWPEACAISLLVFPTLASRSNVTFNDSVVRLKKLSYILAKEMKHLFETYSFHM